VVETGDAIEVILRSDEPDRLEKRLRFVRNGEVVVSYSWDPGVMPAGAYFAPELSVASDPGLAFDPAPAEVWRHEIVTVSKKESGYEETVQGESVTPRWPCRAGRATVRIPARS